MMELTNDDKKLKEAIKILLRDGKAGRLYEAAKDRYSQLKNYDSLYRLAHEINGVDWTENYKKDIEAVDAMIQANDNI